MSNQFTVYLPYIRQQWLDEQANWERLRQQAWTEARRMAAWLREQYGVDEVIVFGSLVDSGAYDARSDIDLAVKGLSPDHFFRVWAQVAAVCPEFAVDIIDIDDCPPALHDVILHEGIPI